MKKLDKVKLVKAVSRERIGKVPATRRIEKKKPKPDPEAECCGCDGCGFDCGCLCS